jgi:hypothetical protein
VVTQKTKTGGSSNMQTRNRLRTSTPDIHRLQEATSLLANAEWVAVRSSGVLALQETAGNSATAGWIQRQTTLFERQDGKSTGPVVQRDPIFAAVTSSQTPGSVPPPTPDKLRKLNIDTGTELRRLAGGAIHQAAIEFQMGCMDVKDDIAKRAKQTNEMLSLMVDILAGFAAPAFAGTIVAAGLLRKNLAAAVKQAGSQDPDLAWTALWDEANIMDEMHKRGLDLVPAFLDKVSGDNLKATFTGAAKAATTAIKNGGPTLSGAAQSQVADQMGQLALQAAQDLDRSLSTLQEPELTALLISLDASVANKTQYADSIRRYMTEVLQISGSSSNQFGSGAKKLVKMNAYGGPRLAIVETGMEGIIIGTPFTDFVSWVSPAMEQPALAKAGLTIDQVPEIDPDTVGNTPFGKKLTTPGRKDSRILH